MAFSVVLRVVVVLLDVSVAADHHRPPTTTYAPKARFYGFVAEVEKYGGPSTPPPSAVQPGRVGVGGTSPALRAQVRAGGG